MNWLLYFQRNRDSYPTFPWRDGIQVESHLRDPLIRSLQCFQVGESGEGRHLRRGAAATGNAEYAMALNLFIKEEQDHARWLAEILGRLNAPVLQRHWTDSCFVVVRHLMGLKQELLVLLMAEMIARHYYRTLHDGTCDPVLRAVFSKICQDEEGHLAFHVDFLRQAFSRWPFVIRWFLSLGWRAAYRIVCAIVIYDHRHVIRACGLSLEGFWWDCGRTFEEISTGIFHPLRQTASYPAATSAQTL